MKIIFMGTPDFAVRILDEINKNFEVVLVVTQPDTYNYRKKKYEYSPVKSYALEHNLEIFQPESIKKEADYILGLDVDLIVTAAYGQFVPKKILDHPKYRAINVHGSILPKYRGGAPIQRAIINGDAETGITIMYMDRRMDAGDILRIEKIPILDEDTQDTMFEKLSILGSKMIVDVINDLRMGKIIPIPQDESKATYAYNLTKQDELIDFNNTARGVFNQIRGLNSNPGAYFILDGMNIKVYNSKVVDKTTQEKPGIIIGVNKDSFEISCGGNTVIALTEVQMPGKKRMSARDFLNGSGRNLISINKEVNL
jgi:methionyl-tRNA formyltransferase